MSWGPKSDKPCGGYFGNLCTGFGSDDTHCWSCGWDRWDHESEQSQGMRDLIEKMKEANDSESEGTEGFTLE